MDVDIEMPHNDDQAAMYQLGYEWALADAGLEELQVLAEARGLGFHVPQSVGWRLWPTLYTALKRQGCGIEGEPINTAPHREFVEWFVNGAVVGWLEMADDDIIKGALCTLEFGPDDWFDLRRHPVRPSAPVGGRFRVAHSLTR